MWSEYNQQLLSQKYSDLSGGRSEESVTVLISENDVSLTVKNSLQWGIRFGEKLVTRIK